MQLVSNDLVTRVAYLHFQRGLRQKEIAELLGLSQSTVCRLMKQARSSGVVEVRAPASSALCATINWRQAAEKNSGETIHVMMMVHSFTESLMPLIAEFEQLTGIKVLYHLLPADEYIRKVNADLLSGGGLIDVFMTSPYINWQFIYKGCIEPLDHYLADPRLTDPKWYDIDDFYSQPIQANRWDGRTLGQDAHGSGRLYAIPVTYEVMSIAYRADLFEEAGIKVDEGWPHTWCDVLYAAEALTRHTGRDGTIRQYGIASRGARTWESMFGGYSNIFYSYGALDFDHNMVPAVASDQGIDATSFWVDLIRRCAAPETIHLWWPEARQRFAEGNAAMIIDCDWFAATTFEQPEVSNVAGRLRYALTPPGPNGMRVQDTYYWSLAMNPASYHKIASWLFIQWATSKPVMLHTTMEYQNWNPSRKSVWEDPHVVAESEKWANYRQVVEDSRKYGKVVHSVNPWLVATHDAWWSNVRDAIAGSIAVKDALRKTEQDMRSMATDAQPRR